MTPRREASADGQRSRGFGSTIPATVEDDWRPPDGLNLGTAHPARRYDWWLGGKDNFHADRESGAAIEAVFPTIRVAAQANRGFLRRAVTFLAAEAGIRQCLDIGAGLPTRPNVHEVAQSIAPEIGRAHV